MFAAIVGQGATASAAQLPLLFSLSTPGWATDPHPYNLEVNGVDHIGAVDFRSIEIEMAGPGTNGSLTFELWDPTASVTINEWDEVRFIEHAAERPILFGGFVQSVRYTAWAAAGRTLTVQCVGYGVLLDKKVMVDPYVGPSIAIYISRHLVSIVNRYGGRISALAAGDPETGPWATNAAAGVAEPGTYPLDFAWFAGSIYTSTVVTFAGGRTLRAVVDEMAAEAAWYPRAIDLLVTIAAPIVYWVDSAARLCAYPAFPVSAYVPAARAIYQYDEAEVPGLVVDDSGALSVTRLEYERDDIDRLTAAYVAGGDANGSGLYVEPPIDRAGDLVGIVSDSTSLTPEDVENRGAAAVGETEQATQRGLLAVEADAPLVVWPGRNIQPTFGQLGLTGEDARITSVRIKFTSSAHRTYEIGFGGNAPRGRLTHA